ncbi:MAG: HU family DNA-binding protein [Deltaproteobacteria bacterium]|nr:HU family DNA-binding protein [Deltaproteobacteria bacterium]
MNKTELTECIANKLDISKADAGEFLDTFISTIQENLHGGVKISGLGTFAAQKRNARVARNPQTGAEIQVPAKWVPVFRAGSALKEAATQKKVH